MRSLVIFYMALAVVFAQESGSGSGDEPVQIQMSLTTTMNATFDVVNDTFDDLFCNDVIVIFQDAVEAAGRKYDAVSCAVISKKPGSIIVTFDVIIDGQSSTLSTSDADQILAAVNTNTILGYPLEVPISDLNECDDTSLNNCVDFQVCANLVGSYECRCAASLFDENGDASSCVEPISVTCDDNKMTIEVLQGYLDDNGITSDQIRLTDEACFGTDDGTTATILVDGLETCGTTRTATSTHIVYSNIVSNEAKSTDIIITGATLGATVSCSYPIGVTTSLDAFQGTVGTLSNNNSTQNGTFVAEMQIFEDNTFTNQPGSLEFETSEDLFIQAKLTATDSSLAVKLQDCWATQTIEPNATIQYPLITDMCAVDTAVEGTVNIISSGQTAVAQWSVQVFRFVGDSNTVYIHCDLEICNGPCSEQCTAARRRRSARSLVVSAPLRRNRRQAENNDLAEDRETVGPIFRVEVQNQGLDPIVIVLISVLVFVLLTIFFVLLFVLFRRRREEKDKKSSAAFSSDKHGHVNTGYDY